MSSTVYHKLPANARFSSSDVQRKYRALLDIAAREPVVIVDRGSELVVRPLEQAEFDYAFRMWMQELARFSAVCSAHQDDEPRIWAQQTAFPWIAMLSTEEVSDMAQELLTYTLDAAQRGSLEGVEGCLRAWESTAEIYGQPDVLKQMLRPIVPESLHELVRPDA